MSFRSIAATVSGTVLLLKLVAQGSQRTRFYINVFFYICGMGLCSLFGITTSAFLSLIPRQRFNTNYLVARSFYYYGRLMWGTRISIEGKENYPKKPSIVVGNHQSSFDIFILGGTFPSRTVIMAKKELTYAPLLGQFSAYAANSAPLGRHLHRPQPAQ